MILSRLALVLVALPVFVACATAADSSEDAQSDLTASECKLAEPRLDACPANFDPVCGCDGKTYGNACAAGNAVTAWEPGACAEAACRLAEPRRDVCPANFDPVCGCDGTTYGNACAAANSVTAWTPGRCP